MSQKQSADATPATDAATDAAMDAEIKRLRD